MTGFRMDAMRKSLVVSMMLLMAGLLQCKSERQSNLNQPRKTTIQGENNRGTGKENTVGDRGIAIESGIDSNTVKASNHAEAKIEPKSGSYINGIAKFDANKDPTFPGVIVKIEINGATPGLHGIHIHENGNCSAPNAMSAGAHFNPEGKKHGLPPSEERHLGDLGNISIGNSGKGTLQIMVPNANLKPNDKMSFIGKAIVLHVNRDDGKDPDGHAGRRIGCGVITPISK